MSSNNNSEGEVSENTTLQYKIRRGLGLVDRDAHPMDKEQMGDYMHWFSLAMGIVLGVVCGMVPLTGSVGFAVFALSRLVNVKYATSVLGVDVDEMGGSMSVAFEGFMPSLAAFLLSWIFVYSSTTGAL